MSAQTGSDIDKATREAIGAAIKRERTRLGWMGADVREHAQVDPTSLSMFEQGKRAPRVEVLRRLADAFGVSLAALVKGTPRSLGKKPLHRKSTKRVRRTRSAAIALPTSRRSGATK